MSDRQTFAVGETIRQKHLDAVARDADELTALRRQVSELRAAAIDALAGWRYIRENHGDLYGVGWDRVESALSAALLKDPNA